jgi:hypothetical protein
MGQDLRVRLYGNCQAVFNPFMGEMEFQEGKIRYFLRINPFVRNMKNASHSPPTFGTILWLSLKWR